MYYKENSTIDGIIVEARVLFCYYLKVESKQHMKIKLEPDNNNDQFDGREISYRPPEGKYRLVFTGCKVIKGKKADSKKVRVTWDVLCPADENFQYRVWKDYFIEDGIPKYLKADLIRIFGRDLGEFEDDEGLFDVDKLMGKEADAVIVHKYTDEYEDPLVQVKSLYPPGSFKLQCAAPFAD